MNRITKYSDILKLDNIEIDIQDALEFLIHFDEKRDNYPITYQKNNVTVGISRNLKPKLMFLYEDIEDKNKNVMCYCVDGLNWKVESNDFVSNYNLDELKDLVEVLEVAKNISDPFKVDEETGAFQEILRNFKTLTLESKANKYLKLLIEIKNEFTNYNQKINLHNTLEKFSKLSFDRQLYLTDLNYVDTTSFDCYLEVLSMFRTVSEICELNKDIIKNLQTNE